MTHFVGAVRLILTVGFVLLIGEATIRVFVPQVGEAGKQVEALGWADPEFLEFSPNSNRHQDCKKKVLFLGDSFLKRGSIFRTSGADGRFPTLFGERLKGTCVQIFAGGGWGTDQEVLSFIARGLEWKPDVVVLVYTAISDNSNNMSNYPNKPYFQIGPDKSIVLRRFDGSLVPDIDDFVGHYEEPPIQSYLLNLLKFKTNEEWEDLRHDIATALPESVRNVLRSMFPWADRESVDEDGTKRLAKEGSVDPRYKIFLRNLDWVNPDRRITSIAEDVDQFADLVDQLTWSPETTVSHVSAFIKEEFPLSAYGWELLEGILGVYAQKAKEKDIDVVVMVHPDTLVPGDMRFMTGSSFEKKFKTPAGQFTYRPMEPVDRLTSISNDLGIKFLNPNTEFSRRVKDQGIDEDVVWPDTSDIHYGVDAHSILADILVEYFEHEFQW